MCAGAGDGPAQAVVTLRATGPTALMPAVPGPVASFSAVTVRYGERQVLGPIDWTVQPGERWALLGANGAGKTTLLALLGAERHPTTGRVDVLGEQIGRSDLRVLRRRIGHVGHVIADRLPRHELALDLVLTGKGSLLAPWWGDFDEEDRRRARALLEELRCGHLADQPFSRCSQGERQRVLLARALFAGSELLLLDEPALGVDLPGREALVVSLNELARRPGAPTTVHVAHTLEELPGVTHAILLRRGELIAEGPVEDVLTSQLLSATYEIEVVVHRDGGRYFARAAGRW